VSDFDTVVKHLEMVAETPSGARLADEVLRHVISQSDTPVSQEVAVEYIKELETRITAGDRDALATLEIFLGQTRDVIETYGRMLIEAGA
jgi:hypothetical protein